MAESVEAMDDAGRYINTPHGLLDRDSGEIIELGLNDKPIELKREPAWFKGIKKGFNTLSCMKLSSTEMNVLLQVMSRLKYGNLIVINQTDLAEKLGCNRVSVNRAIKSLEKHVILTKQGSGSSCNEYRLNPAYCWCGNNSKKGTQ